MSRCNHIILSSATLNLINLFLDDFLLKIENNYPFWWERWWHFLSTFFWIFLRMRGSPFTIIRRAEIDDLRFIRGAEVYNITFPWVSIKIIGALWSFFIFQQECRTFFLPSWCWYGVRHIVQAQGWRVPPFIFNSNSLHCLSY